MILHIFCPNCFSLEKTYFLDPLDPFLDTSDDAKTQPKHANNFSEKNIFSTPKLVRNMSKKYLKSVPQSM